MADHPHDGHRKRVKQRYVESGSDAFAPHELVEMLLFFGIVRKDTNPLAHRLMEEFGSVRGVLNAPRDLLLRIEGMNENAATLLTLVGDLHRYCDKEAVPLGSLLINTKERVHFLRPRFDNVGTEVVWMVSLDRNLRVTAAHRLSGGTPTMTEISVRDVLRFALADNAVSVVIAHNHPSGIALPSQLDIDTTIAVARALDSAGIRLEDHLIFAKNNDCVSFAETSVLAPTLRGEPLK